MLLGGRNTGTGVPQFWPPLTDGATATSRFPLKKSSARFEKYMLPARVLVSHGSPKFANSGVLGSAPPSVKLAPPFVEKEKPVRLLPAVMNSKVCWLSL